MAEDQNKKQAETNELLAEENKILRKRLQLQSESLDMSSSLVESLKETLGIRSKQTTFEQNLLTINKDINKAIFNQRSGLSDISTVSKQIAKNNELITKSLTVEVSLSQQVSDIDKSRIEQINVKSKAIEKQNSDLSKIMALGKEERNLRKDEIASLQTKIARNEKYLDTSLKNLSTSAQQLLYTKQQRQELEKQNAEREKESKILKNIDERLGAAGKFTHLLSSIPGIGKYAEEALHHVTEEIKEAAEEGKELPTRFEAMKMVLGGMAGQITKILKDPLTLTLLAAHQIIHVFQHVDKEISEVAKSMGVGRDEAQGMVLEMEHMANHSNNVFINTEKLVKANTELNKLFGTAVVMNEEMLVSYTELTTQAGYSVEEASKLAQISVANGDSIKENTSAILGQVAALNAENGLAINTKDIMADISKISSATTLTLGNQPEKLAAAAFKAKQFGMELNKLEDISQGLLNFEESISAELEAELLTGKQLNFEQARFLALQGKTGEAAAEVAKQVGSSADFADMGVLAQEALAKSVGLSRDDLAQSILDREVLAKLGEKEGTAQEAYNNLKKQGLSDDAIAAKLGDEKLATQLKSQSIQDRFNASIAKMQELFVSVAEPILAIVSPLMDLVMIVLPLINKLLQPIKTTFDGISKIISGDLENLSFWEAALGGIAVVLGGILGLNRAISVIEARVTLAKELQLGLGAQILTGLGLQNMALNYQIAREQGMNVLRAIGVTLEQTKLGAIIAQGVGIVKNIGKLIIENAARFAGAIAAITTASAATLGIGIAAIVAGIAAGAMALKSAQKADDMVSEGGYGKRTLLAPEGAIKLNDKDTVIAGTNLGGGGGTQASTSSPSIDLSPLLAKMDQMNTILNQLLAKEGTVTLDGNKVGTALTMGSYKIQ